MNGTWFDSGAGFFRAWRAGAVCERAESLRCDSFFSFSGLLLLLR